MDPARGAAPGHLDGARGVVVMPTARKLSAIRISELEARARRMRCHPTPSEQALWQALRGRRLGVAFRRQVRLGEYIVDFLAPGVRLIVEVDGGYHCQRRSADARRERWLRRQGYRIVRLEAELVMGDLELAVALVLRAVR
jgi:very-short-patch-repair endonuclease